MKRQRQSNPLSESPDFHCLGDGGDDSLMLQQRSHEVLEQTDPFWQVSPKGHHSNTVLHTGNWKFLSCFILCRCCKKTKTETEKIPQVRRNPEGEWVFSFITFKFYKFLGIADTKILLCGMVLTVTSFASRRASWRLRTTGESQPGT